MEQLLDALTVHLWDVFLSARSENGKPIPALYDAIEIMVEFGMLYPEIYIHSSKPRGSGASDLWRQQFDLIEARISKVAKHGHLKAAEAQAMEVIYPACVGLILTCLNKTSDVTHVSWLVMKIVNPFLDRDDSTEPGAKDRTPAHASALAARLDKMDTLTYGERALMKELLERIASM